jgi:restriction system protein
MKKKDQMPSFDKMMWPLLQALNQAGGSATNQELLYDVSQIMELSEDTLNILHHEGPMTEVAYRLAWARTYLKKAGIIDNSSRGIWSVLPSGRHLSESDLKSIPAKVRKGEFEGATDKQVEERIGAEEHSFTEWKDQLLKVLKNIPADSFERLAQRILRESGFIKVEVTGRSGDGGIDGIGVLRLNLISFHVFFQCKRYKDTVGPNVIRDFRGAMVGRTDKGLVITTGRFTAEAQKEASRDGAPPVELIDGDQLCNLLKDLKLGVKTELVEKVAIDSMFWGNFF